MNVTLFESHVYLLCSQIPLGKVSTYRLLGKSLECSCSQAIGQALKRNPFAPSPVPCHRVIKTDLDIGGFNGIVNKNHEKILCGDIFFDGYSKPLAWNFEGLGSV